MLRHYHSANERFSRAVQRIHFASRPIQIRMTSPFSMLITVNMPEIKSCANIINIIGHESGGVDVAQVPECLPMNEVAPPPAFLHTHNFNVIEQITKRSLILTKQIAIRGSGVQRLPPSNFMVPSPALWTRLWLGWLWAQRVGQPHFHHFRKGFIQHDLAG